MKRIFLTLFAIALEMAGTFSREDVARAEDSPLCSPPGNWLPDTPDPFEKDTPAHRPASDCGFYAPAWQRFLLATHAGKDGWPAFLSYPTFDSLFKPAP